MYTYVYAHICEKPEISLHKDQFVVTMLDRTKLIVYCLSKRKKTQSIRLDIHVLLVY